MCVKFRPPKTVLKTATGQYIDRTAKCERPARNADPAGWPEISDRKYQTVWFLVSDCLVSLSDCLVSLRLSGFSYQTVWFLFQTVWFLVSDCLVSLSDCLVSLLISLTRNRARAQRSGARNRARCPVRRVSNPDYEHEHEHDYEHDYEKREYRVSECRLQRARTGASAQQIWGTAGSLYCPNSARCIRPGRGAGVRGGNPRRVGNPARTCVRCPADQRWHRAVVNGSLTGQPLLPSPTPGSPEEKGGRRTQSRRASALRRHAKSHAKSDRWREEPWMARCLCLERAAATTRLDGVRIVEREAPSL
jgi:hypothetical protein